MLYGLGEIKLYDTILKLCDIIFHSLLGVKIIVVKSIYLIVSDRNACYLWIIVLLITYTDHTTYYADNLYNSFFFSSFYRKCG